MGSRMSRSLSDRSLRLIDPGNNRENRLPCLPLPLSLVLRLLVVLERAGTPASSLSVATSTNARGNIPHSPLLFRPYQHQNSG
jgi:hypothetical protein